MSFIKIKNLDLKFTITGPDKKSIRNLFKPKKNKKDKLVHALRNINLEINDGDKIGLIGTNGAGKSSLLRIMSQIYEPTSGTCEINGEYNALLENDAGLQLDGDIIDNIYILLLLRGFNYSEIKNKIDWIIDFSELTFALNRPVRTFSTGMIIRMITTIMISNKPKILILDEFFGTADKNFSDKLNLEFSKQIKKSGIFICASHNHELLRRLCNRFIEIEKGQIISDRPAL